MSKTTTMTEHCPIQLREFSFWVGLPFKTGPSEATAIGVMLVRHLRQYGHRTSRWKSSQRASNRSS